MTRKENRFVTFKLRRVSFRPLEPSDETIEKISIHSGVARTLGGVAEAQSGD